MILLELPAVDVIFFTFLLVLVLIAVALYFLIPVFNKKKYKQARDEYKAREEAFRKNKEIGE